MATRVTEPGYRQGRVPANKGRTYPAEVLTSDEVNSLIAACSNKAPTGIRNRALIVVLYRGGLRSSEALALRPKDVDLDTGTITVLHGKGDHRRIVAIDPTAMTVVARWMDTRAGLTIGGRRPLLCTLSGGSLKPSYVRTLLPRLADKAGIDKRVHPHGLRHSMAFEMVMEGIAVTVIQEVLGHSSLATTERYLRHLAPKDVIETMRQREWDIDLTY